MLRYSTASCQEVSGHNSGVSYISYEITLLALVGNSFFVYSLDLIHESQ